MMIMPPNETAGIISLETLNSHYDLVWGSVPPGAGFV